MKYIDLGGGMKVKYWKDDNNLWHMESDVTGEKYISYEEFNADIFLSTSKLNEWLANAEKIK